jgi:hypothetical protein
MFEHYLEPAPTEPRRRATAVVVGTSVFAHLGLGAILILAGFWDIEKLELQGERVVMLANLYPTPLPMAGGGDGKLPPKKRTLKGHDGEKRIKKTAVDDLQPSDEPPVEEDTQAGTDKGATDGETDGSEFGHELGADNGTGIGIHKGDGHCPMPVCGLDTGIPKVVVPDEPPEVEDTVVLADVLRGNRIRGHDKIAPPEQVLVAMVHAGETELEAVIKLCINAKGRVRDLSFVKSSGYAEYDDRFVSEMQGWVYRPYTLDGKALPVCTAVHFKFRMK